MSAETSPLYNRFYDDLADWWPLFSAPADYAEEAAFYSARLIEACEKAPRTCLELGSGGGNNASFMKSHFAMTLVEPSDGMLDVSRRLNPECEHHRGDMRTTRLGRTFDGVFIHDAICYMTTEADLRAAIETAFIHCAPGGAALFAPDFIRETFRSGTDHGGEDAADGRGFRYLEWSFDPDPSDTTYVVDYAFLLREADGATAVVHDRHIEGLFARADWMRWIEEAGFVAEEVHFAHPDVEDLGLIAFVGKRPGDSAVS
ncbi:MAG: class I SAM-dependent methyltransferase [Rhodothermales bacterium]